MVQPEAEQYGEETLQIHLCGTEVRWMVTWWETMVVYLQRVQAEAGVVE